ncbi:probable RNA-binding protein EIF1AD isoform X3 [Zootoca vivipara]|uniref:probable RNA-binding protein EIF1AD isoform X3 n=1 Tax=Zootoca vivipara TaxID=8524 RepID=UPI001591F384|nr:probable RNA-binding protein EIF1AD isoform X3 [Zootoca vivipara]XP_034954213.1 probable RNA-binding protein EIF1AD isoform X3 [Zootoca vivipara]XP_060125811.1 probable RNA-binding protein EIF1AD isoform X3 [Zootoca vivipara]
MYQRVKLALDPQPLNLDDIGCCWKQVVGTPGNNLHEVETSEGTRFLVSMPTKFRKNIWIKRGDFLLVDPIEEGEKVKAEISFVLYKDHVRYLKKEGYWPEAFLGGVAGAQSSAKDSRDGPQSPPRSAGEEDSEDDDADLFVNTNRVNYNYLESEDSSDSDEEEK